MCSILGTVARFGGCWYQRVSRVPVASSPEFACSDGVWDRSLVLKQDSVGGSMLLYLACSKEFNWTGSSNTGDGFNQVEARQF